MNPIIHNAVHFALTERPQRRSGKDVWVSDMGKNPYFLAKRLLTGGLEEFDYPTLLKMDNGVAFEGATISEIGHGLEDGLTMITQFPLFDDVWSGYADIVLGHKTDTVYIYDIKGSAGQWWDYKESFPRATDCLQVWKYGELYYAKYGVKPTLGLYYRGWGTWAEFHIKEASYGLAAIGHVTNSKGEGVASVTRPRFVAPQFLSDELEAVYSAIMADGDGLGPGLIEQLGLRDPEGPDWDYAERRTEEFRTIENQSSESGNSPEDEDDDIGMVRV